VLAKARAQRRYPRHPGPARNPEGFRGQILRNPAGARQKGRLAASLARCSPHWGCASFAPCHPPPSVSTRGPSQYFNSLLGEGNSVTYIFGSLIAIAFLPVFVAIWCGFCLLLAKIGGWSALAVRFPAVEEPAGEKFRFCSVRIGIALYRSATTAIKTDTGLYLSMYVLFRLGHPAILIPWSEMKNPQAKRIFGASWIEVTISTPSIIVVRLPAKIVEGKLPNT
jgi:hypothetical protein